MRHDPFWTPSEGERLAARLREARARINASDREVADAAYLVVIRGGRARTVVVPVERAADLVAFAERAA